MFVIMTIYIFCALPPPHPPPTPFISPTILSFAKHFVDYTCCAYIILTIALYILTSMRLCCFNALLPLPRGSKLH
jgi:hypothetical protein